jgi:hypothetical protein
MVEAHLRKEKTSQSIQDNDGQWCILHHLLGCCFLAQAQCASHGILKEKKVNEAVCCFFRYSIFSTTSERWHWHQTSPGFKNLKLLLSCSVFFSMYYYVVNNLVSRGGLYP